jgi:1-deoxy-D-xylulose-5-phosphate synthase
MALRTPAVSTSAIADEAECRLMLQTAYEYPGPAMVRYPRGSGSGALPAATLATLAIGEGEIRRDGNEIAILAFGSMLQPALTVAEWLACTVANMRFVKPLDAALIRNLASRHRLLVTVEENVLAGGAGSAVNEFLAAEGIGVRVLNLGLPDHFIEQAKPQEQLHDCGLDAAGIAASIRHAAAALAAVG